MRRLATAGAEVRGLVRGTGDRLGGRDLAGASATVTYFAAIAVVPWLLLALWTTRWWWGEEGAEQRWLALRVLVPPDMGARGPYEALVHAGTHVGPLGAAVLLFPASFYGEGLRRAVLALAPPELPDRFTGWRGRLAVLPLVLALPLLAWAWFAVGEVLVPLAPEGGGDGAADRVLRIVLGFAVSWLVLAGPLGWVYRVVVPDRPRWWVALAGGLATASFLAGFLHGFQLFLAIPIDVGLPFAGLGVVGGVVAVGLWLYVLHTVLLVGWAATSALEARVSAGAAR